MRLLIWMGWIWVTMRIEAEDKVELRIDGEGVPVERQRNSGGGSGGCERRVVGRENRVAENILIRVQQDAWSSLAHQRGCRMSMSSRMTRSNTPINYSRNMS